MPGLSPHRPPGTMALPVAAFTGVAAPPFLPPVAARSAVARPVRGTAGACHLRRASPPAAAASRLSMRAPAPGSGGDGDGSGDGGSSGSGGDGDGGDGPLARVARPISRRTAVAAVNGVLGVVTLALLVRLRAQARLVSPAAVLSAVGAPQAPSRNGVAAASAATAPAAAGASTAGGGLPPPSASSLEYIRKADARGDVRVADFPRGAAWFNAPPLRWGGALKNKVVLLDFWTYCCINCYHVLPGLAALEAATGPAAGFAVVGVHSAKFDAEKDAANVAAAVARYGVAHPVVNDAGMVLWGATGVTGWPTRVLVGPRGNLLALWSGEGNDADVRDVVSAALKFYEPVLNTTPLPAAPAGVTAGGKGGSATATLADLRYPGKVAVSPDGRTLYVADTGHNRVVALEAETGKATAVWGSPGGDAGFEDSPGSGGDRSGGDVSPSNGRCSFAGPQGVVVDAATRSLYVCDTDNHAVRRVDLDTGGVSTIGGNGTQGFDYGAGKAGSAQRLSSPWDAVLVDLPVDGSLTPHLVVAMAGTHQLWALPLGVAASAAPRGGLSGALTPPDRLASSRWTVFSGTGREAQRDARTAAAACWAQPSGLAVAAVEATGDGDSASSTLVVADSESSSVRAVTIGGTCPTRTLAGGDDLLADNLFAFGDADGRGGRARLQHPLGVAASPDGATVYVADSFNHKIKRLDVAAGAVAGWLGGKGPGAADGSEGRASFWEPGGLAVVPGGELLYVADTNNGAVRRVDVATGTVSTLAVSGIPDVLAAAVAGGGAAAGGTAAGGSGGKRLIENRKRVRTGAVPEGVAAAASTDTSLRVTLRLPVGSHWTDGAPSSWQVNAVANGGAMAGRLAAGRVSQTGPAGGVINAAGLAVPAAGGNTPGLEVEARCYYCGADGVCRMEAVVWQLPVLAAADGGDAAVVLEHTVGGRG